MQPQIALLDAGAEGRHVVAELRAGPRAAAGRPKAEIPRQAEAVGLQAIGVRGVTSAVGGAAGDTQAEPARVGISDIAAAEPGLISHGTGEGVRPAAGIRAAG